MSLAALVVVALLQPGSPGDGAAKPAAKPAAKKGEVREVKADPPPAGRIDGPGPLDEPRKVAEAYLNALSGKGGEDSRDLLLGGATLTARDFNIPNWRIVNRDEARVEEKSIFGAMKAMWMLDKIGAEALNMVVVQEDDSLNLTQEQAAKMLAPTREAAVRFQDDFPLFSYVARVDKDVFWHPENPWRREAKKLGKEGNYRLELHRFMVEEREQGKQTRLWPLRVLRVKSAKYDSGWKILPASDWDPNY